MNREPTDFNESLEAYLDQTMSAEQRASFERELEIDSSLAEAVALQERIDGSLRQQFDVASMTAPPLPEAGRDSSAYRPAKCWQRPVAIAAAVLLTAAGLWSALIFVSAGDIEPLATVYARQIDNGFVPGWVCENDEQFAQSFDDQFQQPLLLAAASGVEPLGLTYNYALGARTVMLLARVEGEPVIVFAGPTRLINEPPRAGSRRLNLFERQIGSVKLFELTPFDEPRLLPDFYTPEDDQTGGITITDDLRVTSR